MFSVHVFSSLPCTDRLDSGGAPAVNRVPSLAHPRNIDTRLASGASLLNLPRWFSPNQQGTAFGEVLRFATPYATLLLQTFNSLLPVGCGKGEVIARRNESLLSMSMSFKYSKLNDPLINATSNTRVRKSIGPTDKELSE